MVQIGVLHTKYTYPIVLKACGSLRDVENGLKIHVDVKRCGLDGDVYVCTGLVDFSVKCGWLERAWKVFDEMPERDIVCWNAMISGCAVHELFNDVIGVGVRGGGGV
ncbi:hypothetical protein LIER_09806 [Lithospermum erythrorhizon]|uniref:Pentatricopeptide repeat-containing protein n=1 Tax=Lithospermum erythrorhizon TaxID=34254 RepID=A0AAV3PIB1_LITER